MKKVYWQKLSGVIALTIFSITANSQTGGDAIIYPQKKTGVVVTDLYFDLKMRNINVHSTAKATDLFFTDDMNGVRIPIHGEKKRPAHPGPGQVDESYYEDILKSIDFARQARNGKKLVIFASKKLDGKESFPNWVKNGAGVIPGKYARLIADFIMYMNNKGVHIDYLGPDNEFIYNEGNITPLKHKQIIDSLKIYSQTMGFDMPKIVGYEDYGPWKRDWVKTFFNNGWDEYMDVYGTHYYPQWRPKSKLENDLSYIGDIPFWSTEAHWDDKKDQDVFVQAEEAMCALWDQTDLGMSGLTWWAYNYNGKRGAIMRSATAPLKDAYPIDMDDKDGRDIMSLGTLQTRAFREENRISVYVVNMSSKNYDNYGFILDGGTIDGVVIAKQWTDASSDNGNIVIANNENDNKFSLDIPSRSVSYVYLDIENVVSSNKITKNPQFVISPNPAQNTLKVSGVSSGNFSIYDSHGKLIITTNKRSIDVSYFTPGIYIIRDHKGHNKRFIKM